MPRAQSTSLAALLGVILSGIVACGGAEGGGSGEGRRGAETPTVQLRISAAASLTDAFSAMDSAFEEVHPDVDVQLNLGGSSALRVQVLEGAPIDVFASANPSNMQRVVEAGEVEESPVVFARNYLVIAVPPGNPAGVRGLKDFSDEELVIGLCAAAVPCGDFARESLARAGVTPAVDTNEPDVRALLTKIELGEIDAGITYFTDVASAGEAVESIEISEKVNVAAEYPIAVLARTPNPDAANAFVDFVLSDAGQAILLRHGFARP